MTADNDNKPSPDKASLGASIRHLVNSAFRDPRTKEWQLEKLDKLFASYARAVPIALKKEFDAFNSYIEQFPKEKRTKEIVEALTIVKGDDDWDPTFGRKLPINAEFLNLSSADIRALPGYIRLHEAMRDLDVAIKVAGLTREEEGHQPVLVVNTLKTYAQGAAENPGMYPTLPDKKKSFQPDTTEKFTLKK